MYWNSYFKLPFKTLNLATQMHNFKMVKLSLTNGAAVKKKKKDSSLPSDCNKLQVNMGKFKIFRLIKVQINVYKTNSNIYFTQYDWQVFKHFVSR